MRLPRDLSGEELAHKLQKFGYAITRQSSSHMRLTTHQKGEHHVTIPNHKALRVGTLNNIIKDVADHLGMQKSELMSVLFR